MGYIPRKKNPSTGNRRKLGTLRRLLEIVREANVVKGAERHVLFALCMRANTKKNFTCFPSYAQIVEDSSVGLSQVKVAVRELAKAGWIRRQIRPNTSNLVSSTYRL